MDDIDLLEAPKNKINRIHYSTKSVETNTCRLCMRIAKSILSCSLTCFPCHTKQTCLRKNIWECEIMPCSFRRIICK